MEEMIQQCKDRGLRNTVALRAIIQELASSDLPLSLQDLEVNEALSSICDRATIFRTLQRLEGIGLLRRLNFSHSGAKFTLNTGENHNEYLICRNCGEVRTVEMACPVHKLEQDLAEAHGFTSMTHELTFYGLCAKCQN